MKDPEEIIDNLRYNLRNTMKGLFIAFPNVNYIGINPSITLLNQDKWKNEWYMVLFEKEPWLNIVDGFPAWVAEKDISTGEDEVGFVFIHFNADGFYIDDELIERNKNDFFDIEDLCFTRGEDNEVVKWKNSERILTKEKEYLT